MKNKKTEKQAINSIGMFDSSKGILMLFVVLAHSMSMFFKFWEVEPKQSIFMLPLAVLKIFVYGVIPMFFMMSGYGFRKQNMKKCIKQRMHYLIKPYLCVALVVVILTVVKRILTHGSIIDALKYQGFPFLLGLCPGETFVFGWYTASIGPVWFLMALALAWILLNWMFHIENEVIRLITMVSIIALVIQLPFYSFVPFCFLQSICCMGFIYIGYHIKKKHLLTYKFATQTYIIFILILAYSFLFGWVDVSQNVWQLGFFDYIASCISGYFLLRMSVKLECYEGKLIQVLRFLGKNSLYILGVHTVEYLVFPWDRLIGKVTSNVLMSIILLMATRVIVISIGCVGVKIIIKLFRKKRA